MLKSSQPGMSSGINEIMSRRQTLPSSTPIAPPTSARMRLSVRSCRTIWLRDAPIAVRMAISRALADPRTIISPAMFTQAISRTIATAANSTCVTARKSPR